MKTKHLYIFFFALLISTICANAQENRRYDIKADQPNVQRIGDLVMINTNINLDNLDLPSQQMIMITPVIRSADRSRSQAFAPIVITGGTRDKALKRSMGFGNFEFEKTPQLIVRHHNNKPQSIPLSIELPYEEWLHEADLVLVEDVTGCACKAEGNDEYSINNILPPLFVPRYELSYATPPVEEVKRRSETYSARINFELNKYKILYNFKNNKEVLDEVNRIVSELRSDPNLTITEFSITGYASPEGVPQSNMTLSENRARSFVAYLRENYQIKPDMMKVDWKGEDWEGLRKVVTESNLADKNQILEVLDETNVMTRKNKLKQLSGGQTYRTLLSEYYPPLRRNEYTVSYIAKPFNVDEAKAIIKTKPRHLSENEIFLVANTYPKNSQEFKETFDVAANIYPNNPYTQLNTTTLDIENGNRNNALMQRLERIDMPEAWNNLGIMYAEQGDLKKAEEYFNKASDAGLKEAIANREQLSKLLKNTMGTISY